MNFEDFLKSLSEEQKDALYRSLKESKGDNVVEEQKPLPSKQQDFTVEVTEDFRVNRNNNNNIKGGRVPVKARKNEWYDEGEFKDVETPKGKKTPRNRERTKMIDVECHICGKTFPMNPNYVYGEFQRCSRCAGK